MTAKGKNYKGKDGEVVKAYQAEEITEIPTIHGTMIASAGDWIVDSETPMTDQAFNSHYKLVEEKTEKPEK